MARRKFAKQLATRFPMMPHDTNGAGHIFGGVLLSHIDLAGAIAAHAEVPGLKRLVTRAMSQVEFKKPVLVNDIVSCNARVTRIGTSSIGVRIDVEVDRAGKRIQVTKANAVYVAVDQNDNKIPIPGGTKSRKRPAPQPVSAPLDPSKRLLASKQTMLPKDTNGMGNIFGGVLLSHMDLAGSYVARRACSNSYIRLMVTRVMDKVEFKEPVKVNDVISCYGTVTKIGQTSVTVHVEVEADRAGQIIHVTSCDMVFVALDEAGNPTSVLCSSPQGLACQPSAAPAGDTRKQ